MTLHGVGVRSARRAQRDDGAQGEIVSISKSPKSERDATRAEGTLLRSASVVRLRVDEASGSSSGPR